MRAFRTKSSSAFTVLALVLFASLSAHAQWRTFNPVVSVEQKPDRVVMALKEGVLTIQVCSDSILHVTSSPAGSIPERPEFVIQKTACPAAQLLLGIDNC